MVSLTMHSRFIFLFLLHKAIANQEYPLSKTNDLSSPTPDLLPGVPVASVAPTPAAVLASASQPVETGDGNGECIHYRKSQEAPFPIEPSYTLIFNDGVTDSVPNEGSLRSGYINLLPRSSKGNALEIDTRGVVRVKKQFGLSTPVDGVVSAYPESIGPDDKDPTRNARPEEKRSSKRNHLHLTGSHGHLDRVGRCATSETKDRYPMLHSNNQVPPQPAHIFSGEGESLNRQSPSLTPSYLDEYGVRSLAQLDGEHISEDITRTREDRGGHRSGANSGSEYPLFMGDDIFDTAPKGSTRPVTTRSESGINEGHNQKEWSDESHFKCLCPTFMANNQFGPPLSEHGSLRGNTPSPSVDCEVRGEEAVPTPAPPRTSDPPLMPLIPGNVIRGVSSTEFAHGEVYKLQRGDDGRMRSVPVKRLDPCPGIREGLGRPTRFVEISHDGKVYVVGDVGPVGRSGGVCIPPVGPITIPKEPSPISRKRRPAKPVSTLDSFGSEAVGSLDSLSVFETSDHWRAESIESFHPFDFRKEGGPHSSELGRCPNKPATLDEMGWRPLARRSHSLGGRSRVSLDPSPSAIYAIELGDDGGMHSRTVKGRSSRGFGSTSDFEPILPDSSLDTVNFAWKDGSTHRHGAGARSSGDRVSINSPLMEDRDGKVYHKTIQTRLGNEVNVFSLPGPVQPTGIRMISMNEIGQLSSKDLENRGRNCLLKKGGQTASGSSLGPAGCTIQEGIDGKPHPRNLNRRSIDGADYLMPSVGGEPIQRVPDLAQAVDGDGEVSVGTGGGVGMSDATNMTLLLHSMTLDKLAVMLPLVMFGTLLLVLVIFGMTFCCLRQAEETYYINIKAVENRRRRNRNLRRRRKNGASIGAAEEGDITVRPGAPSGQPEVGNTNRGWFLQRWYNSLRGDATHKIASFSGAEVTSHLSPKSNLRRAGGLDGGQHTRDPSHVLGAVSDRLQQTRGPRSLSTIWSNGRRGSSAIGKVVLATGGNRSEGPSLNTAMMSRRMHGAKGDTSTEFRQESISTTEGAGLSGNPSSDLTLTFSPVEGFADTSCADGQEALRSEGTFRMAFGGDPSIQENLIEPKEFDWIRPDLYLSGPGAEDTSESSEPGKGSWTGGNGVILRRREGDTRGREGEAGPSGTVEGEERLGLHQ